MIQFLYQGLYETQENRRETIRLHGVLFGLACKYRIEGLKTYAASRFHLAKMYGDEADIVDALREAYRLAELP